MLTVRPDSLNNSPIGQATVPYRGTLTGLIGAKKLRVAYSDESGVGSLKAEPISVVTAIVMNMDKSWAAVESGLRRIIKSCPKNLLFREQELKGALLYGAARRHISKARTILAQTLAITVNEQILIYYGAVDRKGWELNAKVAKDVAQTSKNKPELLKMAAIDRAFDTCIARVDNFAAVIGEHVLWIADVSDPERERSTKVGLSWIQSLKATGHDPISYRFIKRNYDRVRIADAIYFGRSHESLALQLADVCWSTITLHLLEKFYQWRPIVEPFYEIICGGNALMVETEPEYRNWAKVK
jgi:hypothetical protein